MYKTHEKNIPQIRDAVAQFGTIWFHGDGNMFDKKADSDFRIEFSNPDADESKARIEFRQGDHIPATVEELNRLIANFTQREKAQKKAQEKTGNPIKLLRATESAPAGQTSREANAPGAEDLKKYAAHLESREEDLNQRSKSLLDTQSQIEQQTRDAQTQIEGKAKELTDRQAQLDQLEKDLQAREKKLLAAEKKAGNTQS